MPGNDDSADLDLLIAAAHDAAAVARRHAGGDLETVEKPDGAGPVTVADIAVNDALEKRLRDARPAYGWLSEESPDDPGRMSCESAFIIDPIDGTRSFIEGSDTWAHSLAVARRGRVTAAVVYLPAKERMYTARAGGGAARDGHPITCTRRTVLEHARVLAAAPVFEPRHWRDGRVPPLVRHHRPSLAYRLSLVAEGRFDAMLTLRDSWEWDIAAGSLILSEAQAVVSDRTGAPLAFNSARPKVRGVLAGPAALHATCWRGFQCPHPDHGEPRHRRAPAGVASTGTTRAPAARQLVTASASGGSIFGKMKQRATPPPPGVSSGHEYPGPVARHPRRGQSPRSCIMRGEATPI